MISSASAWNSEECSRCPCPWVPRIRIGVEMGIRALLFSGLELFCSPSVLVVVVAIPTFGPRERMEYRRPLGLEVSVSLVLR